MEVFTEDENGCKTALVPHVSKFRSQDWPFQTFLRFRKPQMILEIYREVKHDVYGKRQTAKMKLLPSVFSSQYSRIKIFVSVVNSKRHFSIFV